jgi:hypothetical protein
MTVNFRDEMKLFVSKLLVVMIVFGVLLSIGIVSAAAAIESLSRKVSHELWINNLYDQLVALTPEKKEEAHRKLASTVAILQPYLADLRPLYEAVHVGDSCKDKQ